MDASVTPDETMTDVLGARARRSPLDRLVLDVVGGVLVAAAAFWARPAGWVPLSLAAACFCFYGVWALSVRRLDAAVRADAGSMPRGWKVTQQVAAAGGVVAFLALLFALLGVALGPITS